MWVIIVTMFSLFGMLVLLVASVRVDEPRGSVTELTWLDRAAARPDRLKKAA